jgi:hypothetical protein
VPKHHPKQMSLPFLPSEQGFLPKTAEELKEMDAEAVAYLDNMKRPHQNFPEGSEAWLQWTYTGRKKKDKETIKNATQIRSSNS